MKGSYRAALWILIDKVYAQNLYEINKNEMFACLIRYRDFMYRANGFYLLLQFVSRKKSEFELTL